MRDSRPAFTLLEVVVALAIGSLVVLSSVTLARAIDDASRSANRNTTAAARRAIAESTLGDLVYQATDGRDSTERFFGTADSARFRSRCATGYGWLEPCTVELHWRRGGIDSLVAVSSVGDTAAVAAMGCATELIYMAAVPPDLKWRAVWSGESAAPRAVALASPRDTIVFRLAPR